MDLERARTGRRVVGFINPMRGTGIVATARAVTAVQDPSGEYRTRAITRQLEIAV
jgi:hypothetical protein